MGSHVSQTFVNSSGLPDDAHNKEKDANYPPPPTRPPPPIPRHNRLEVGVGSPTAAFTKENATGRVTPAGGEGNSWPPPSQGRGNAVYVPPVVIANGTNTGRVRKPIVAATRQRRLSGPSDLARYRTAVLPKRPVVIANGSNRSLVSLLQAPRHSKAYQTPPGAPRLAPIQPVGPIPPLVNLPPLRDVYHISLVNHPWLTFETGGLYVLIALTTNGQPFVWAIAWAKCIWRCQLWYLMENPNDTSRWTVSCTPPVDLNRPVVGALKIGEVNSDIFEMIRSMLCQFRVDKTAQAGKISSPCFVFVMHSIKVMHDHGFIRLHVDQNGLPYSTGGKGILREIADMAEECAGRGGMPPTHIVRVSKWIDWDYMRLRR